MSRKVTLRDIAEKSGVSLATVSNALNGHWQHVSEETAQKVLHVANELGYIPIRRARKTPRQTTQIFGIVVAGMTPSFTQAITHAISVADRFGFHAIVCDNAGREDNEVKSVAGLVERGVDGIVFISSSTYRSTAALRLAQDARIPVVSVNRRLPLDYGTSIVIDNKVGGFVATEHLIELGHRHIACIHLPHATPKEAAANQRLEGYHAAMAKHGLSPAAGWVRSAIGRIDTGIALGQAVMQEMLQADKKPTAVVCGNDYLAAGALRAATKARLNVPDDFAIVGYDDLEASTVTMPALTTMRQPMDQAGTRAVEILIHHLWQGDDMTHVVTLEPQLIVRGSTVPLVLKTFQA